MPLINCWGGGGGVPAVCLVVNVATCLNLLWNNIHGFTISIFSMPFWYLGTLHLGRCDNIVDIKEWLFWNAHDATSVNAVAHCVLSMWCFQRSWVKRSIPLLLLVPVPRIFFSKETRRGNSLAPKGLHVYPTSLWKVCCQGNNEGHIFIASCILHLIGGVCNHRLNRHFTIDKYTDVLPTTGYIVHGIMSTVPCFKITHSS